MDIYPEGYPGKKERVVMLAGDSVHIPVSVGHQFFGLEDSEMFEFSTQHFEEDSYRHVLGD